MFRRSVVPLAAAVVVIALAPLGAADRIATIYRFAAGPLKPTPSSVLAEAPDGSLCGAAEHGGADDVGFLYCVTPSGALTVFHSFTEMEGPLSSARLVVAGDGSVYGTTRARDDHELGAGIPPGRKGTPFGTIFHIAPDGRYHTIHVFTGGADGAFPANALVLASDGNLYGVTNVRLGKSAIFKAKPDGVVSVLHEFNWVTDGAPNSLMQASDGDLYGTTATGGSDVNAGTVFRVSLTGRFTLVHVFRNALANEGAGPVGLIQARDGNFYGTTLAGGASLGIVFKLTATGRFETLHSFHGDDGAFPGGGLVEGLKGELYGTTNAAGPTGHGTIFSITTSGNFKQLATMTEPGSSLPLMVGRDGTLYGARAATAIASVGGSVFRLSVD